MHKLIVKCASLALFIGLATPLAAHRFFFGLTDLSVKPEQQKVEVLHQLTAHDVENAIAEIQQIHFSAEHKEYEQMLQNYIETHFQLQLENRVIELTWLGFELKHGKLFIYQEAHFENFLPKLVVKNTLLIDTYPNQVNTLNYQDTVINGSVSFSDAVKLVKIGDNIALD